MASDYYKDYYEANKFKFKENHNYWIKKNKEKWNEYQAWYNRKRYWEKKSQLEPDNQEFSKKLEQVYSEKPSKKL